MILGLSRRGNDTPLKTKKVAEGIYVVENAYQGTYTYDDIGEPKKEADRVKSQSKQSEQTP